MADDTMVDAQDEVFDFSEDGVKPQTVSVEVVGFDIVKTDTGTRHVLEFSVVDANGEILPFHVTKREWVEQDNPKAASIGRGNLKKISNALVGSPKYTRATIVGAKAQAELFENKDGYADLRRFKKGLDTASLG